MVGEAFSAGPVIINMKKDGFTLIELLVVISIIGLLATIVMISLNSARAKARDVRKQADFKQIATALTLFYEKNGRMPGNFHPGQGACEGDGYYEQSMGELINNGLISAVPKSPGSFGYCYYDYGPNNSIGAILVTGLERYSGTTGLPPSCRPWLAGQNWCDQGNNSYYCLCNPY